MRQRLSWTTRSQHFDFSQPSLPGLQLPLLPLNSFSNSFCWVGWKKVGNNPIFWLEAFNYCIQFFQYNVTPFWNIATLMKLQEGDLPILNHISFGLLCGGVRYLIANCSQSMIYVLSLAVFYAQWGYVHLVLAIDMPLGILPLQA